MINKNVHLDFFTSVVVPYCLSISNTRQMHVVVDSEYKLVHASAEYLVKMNYSNIKNITGTSFTDIHKLKDTHPKLHEQYEQIKNTVLNNKQEINYLCVMKLNEQISFNIVQKSPIYNPDGNLIGVFTTIEDMATGFENSANNYISYKLSARQAEIVFLLTIGASQKEIAHIFNVTRGTISSSIDQICIKLKLSGSSEKSVIKSAIELGIGRIPIDSISPCIVPIHRLYNNRHAIRHLFQL